MTIDETFDDGEKNAYQNKINAIRKSIFLEDKRLREKYAWLEHQSAIGLGFMIFSLLGLAVTCWLYISGQISWYVAIPAAAFFYSIIHELEHDNIHELYFKDQKWVQDVFFAIIWFTKIGACPWWRKVYHLKHHKYSGQVQDIEERLIGLGVPLGLKRLMLSLTPLATLSVVFDIQRDSRGFPPELNILIGYMINLPVMLPSTLMFTALFFPSYMSASLYAVVWYYNMLCFLPNTLRQFCLQIISTGCHYYGDIPSKNVYFQNQVLNHWILYPLQALCCNFGATHIIHHYVTRQPFYLRQMGAAAVLDEMKRQGVRFNDLDIFRRSHRYYDDSVEVKRMTAMAS
jgi:fatty acid desaturase